MRRPQTVCIRKRPALSLPLFTRQVMPTASARSRWNVNSVVSWITRMGPSVAAKRSRVAWKWPARICASLTRSLEKKR